MAVPQVLFRLTWRLPEQPEQHVLGTYTAVSGLQSLLVEAGAVDVSLELLKAPLAPRMSDRLAAVRAASEGRV